MRRNKSCIFTKADLSDSVFSFCNLREVSFVQTKLEKTVFTSCDLVEANFTQATTPGITFTNCAIRNTKLDIQGFLNYGAAKGFILEW